MHPKFIDEWLSIELENISMYSTVDIIIKHAMITVLRKFYKLLYQVHDISLYIVHIV